VGDCVETDHRQLDAGCARLIFVDYALRAQVLPQRHVRQQDGVV
jgi:hypothetical protein